MKIHLAFAAILVFALAAGAADVSGKWIGQVTNPMGAKSERIFTLQVSGENVTGTIAELQVSMATFEEKGQAPHDRHSKNAKPRSSGNYGWENHR